MIQKNDSRLLTTSKHTFKFSAEVKQDINLFNAFCLEKADFVIKKMAHNYNLPMQEIWLGMEPTELHVYVDISHWDLNNHNIENKEVLKVENYVYFEMDLTHKLGNYADALIDDFFKYNYITAESIIRSFIIYVVGEQNKMTYLWELNPQHIDVLKIK